MYSGHNFYFKPYIASLALLPVTDRKSLEAPRFINRKHPFDTVQLTTTVYFAHTIDAERHRRVNRTSYHLLPLCASGGRLWSIHSPIFTPERESSPLGRRSQVMSPNTRGIISSG